MLLTKGKLSLALQEKDGKPVWDAYVDNTLVARCEQDEWDLSEPDFLSKEAGQTLLDTYHEIYAAFETEAVEDKDAAMIKTDQGDVKDVLPTEEPKVESDCCGKCGDDCSCGTETEAPKENTSNGVKVIVLQLSDLLNKAAALRNAGEPYAHVMDEITLWTTAYDESQRIATQQYTANLMVDIENDLSNGIDCSAKLFDLSTVLKHLAEIGDYTRNPSRDVHPDMAQNSISEGGNDFTYSHVMNPEAPFLNQKVKISTENPLTKQITEHPRFQEGSPLDYWEKDKLHSQNSQKVEKLFIYANEMIKRNIDCTSTLDFIESLVIKDA